MAHVFISYSRQNGDYARNLADRLIAEGFDVWIDDRINYGENWWRVIVKAIRDCAAFLPVMSPAADESRWVQREVSVADELHKPAFPLLLAGKLIEFDHFLIYISTQYIDVSDGLLPGEALYSRLAQYAPRKDRPGREVVIAPDDSLGLRYDGVYRWYTEGSLFCDCLKFNDDGTAQVFMAEPQETLSPDVLHQVEPRFSFQSQQGKIQMTTDKGRSYTGQIQAQELILRVEFPAASPDYRVYRFVPFA
ncbi:MAG: toll/interleukin-1 receptor domain-containing protein [Anaerolineae bacterium]|jgi:hypothetical protein|nr:toll/interleukin-1 receptor domain-containing protein [Anaerolineae bacterium]